MSGYLPTPISSSSENFRMSQIVELPGSGQYDRLNACIYNISEPSASVNLGASSLSIQQQHVARDGSQRSVVTCSATQYQPGTNDFQPIQAAHPHRLAETAPKMRYRLTLIPILINGEVHMWWYPLPEIVCATAQQIKVQSQASAGQTPDPPSPRNFRPTNMVLEQHELNLTNPCGQSILDAKHYRGDPSSQANRRQVHQLPDAHNCTLWLWNIPESVHVSEIFDKIDIGAVQCCHIVPPNTDYSTCAAKLAFMAPEPAAQFKQKADSLEGIWLKNLKLKVRYNRDGNLRNDTQQSRVLIIEGPCELMTLAYWEDLSKKILQFSFVRLDGQAQACMGAIRSQNEFAEVIRASFAPDRCGDPAARHFELQGRRLY
ncbi:hypothetical protein DL98DRAFT_586223 [Cadophora sp. DSE1049]|nr:hypothetical protein DL98DRAFT_586223 [Cadophora sp. DSE1049]